MHQFKSRKHTNIRRLTLLSTALSMAVVSSFSAHAAENWVSTKTKAFPIKPQATTAADSAATSGAKAPTTHTSTPKAAVTALATSQPVNVTVGLKIRNQAQLDQQVSYLQSGGSRQFLTPAQFTALYSPTQAQVDTVVKYLQKSGYTNIKVAPNRLFVTATGTAASAKKAFNTTLKQFQADNRNVFANETDAQVPQSLSSVVDTVLGLQTASIAKTYHKVFTPVDKAATSKLSTAGVARPLAAATPALTGHNPLEFSTLYGAGATPTASNTAAGIVTWGGVSQTITDLNTYTTNNNLAAVSTKAINVGTGSFTTTSNDAIEWNLDSQSILGAAGGAIKQIVFYNAPTASSADLVGAFNQAVTDNTVKVINASFGAPETGDPSFTTSLDPIFKQAILQGQTVSVSSGDSGVYEASTSWLSGAPGVPNGTNYSVSSPANSAYVVSVGGTSLYTLNGAYSSESVWNEGLRAVGLFNLFGFIPFYDATQRLWATGGGYSTLVDAPSWQTAAITGTTKRAIPDVAFDAASASGANIYWQGSLETVGGTSLAAPIFAGIWARLQSANNNTLGFPAASFYKYFPTNTDLLHDVTSGNNGSGTYTGYPAKVGWDGSTGFGSFDIAKVNAFIKTHPDFSK
ncbi:protease pro-enzyme activation domain-containing protein [Aquirhabdus sp.]|uniref:S53 family peptidase n=1 Tax=Aquirhabdus sp. TaxID=2824160 RepID=UPI00396C9D9D